MRGGICSYRFTADLHWWAMIVVAYVYFVMSLRMYSTNHAFDNLPVEWREVDAFEVSGSWIYGLHKKNFIRVAWSQKAAWKSTTIRLQQRKLVKNWSASFYRRQYFQKLYYEEKPYEENLTNTWHKIKEYMYAKGIYILHYELPSHQPDPPIRSS